MKASNKDLLAFVFEQMEKLDKKEIDVDTAKAQSALAKQANNALKHELDRSNLLYKIEQNDSKVVLREIETNNS